MALQKKFEALDALAADVMVIQECSKKSIDDINAKSQTLSGVWIGSNKNKGLAIVTRSPWRVESHSDLGLNLVIKAHICGPTEFDLFAVWACAGSRHDDRYIRQVHLLLDRLNELCGQRELVVMGDFNSNAIWDRDYRYRNHSEAVERLAVFGLESAYHAFHGEEQGKETNHTLFFRKNRETQYHIDYIFLPKRFIRALVSVPIGAYEEWIRHSDHAPLSVELNITKT